MKVEFRPHKPDLIAGGDYGRVFLTEIIASRKYGYLWNLLAGILGTRKVPKERLVGRKFALKSFRYPGYLEEKDCQHALYMHAFCKRIGLPVIPTYRRMEHSKIIMTDLTFGGLASVYSTKNQDPKSNIKLLPIFNLDEIIAEIKRIADIATKNKLLLESDCLFLVQFSKNGKCILVVGDYDNLKKVADIFGSRNKEAPDENLVTLRISLIAILDRYVKDKSLKDYYIEKIKTL